MNKMHPTTQAIVAGLCDIDLSEQNRLAYIALGVRAFADGHALPDRQVIIQAAQDGWDLGIRTTGDIKYELAASRRPGDTELRLVVTALIDTRSTCGWTYLWAVQNEGPISASSIDFYPNGTAESFAEAIRIVEHQAALRSISTNKD